MPSYRRPSGPREAPKRRSPLKAVLAFLIILLLAAGAVGGILVLSPDLALLVPGGIGDKAHGLATAARTRLELLISDEGPLGGLRRFAEPYLSRVGLNLPTVLLGLGLVIFAVICIRILAVTSRPGNDSEGPPYELAPGRAAPGGHSAYWPYDQRPGSLSAAGGPPPLPEGLAGGWASARSLAPDADSRQAGSGAGGAPQPGAFPPTATGDAWPLVRQSIPRPSRPGPAGQVSEQDAVPDTGQLAGSMVAAADEVAAGPGSVLPGEPALPSPEPAPGQSGLDESPVAPPVPAFEPEGAPAGSAPPPPVATPAGDYLADMPAPAYARSRVPELGEPAIPAAPRPSVETRPPAEAQPREAWIETRPGLGTGLRKFTFPGIMLILLGAGGAYSLETPLASFITGGAYGNYLLGSAAAVMSMAVSVWFMSGPMRSTARRVAGAMAARAFGEAAAGVEPGVVESRFGPPGAMPPLRQVGGGGRPPAKAVAPAPIPGRAALEGGLDAPDAIDWGKLPRPSIFIPGTQSATTVGLDIGTAWIKVIQVGVGRRGLEIVNLGLVPTPEGVLAEGDITDPEALGDVVKGLLSSRNIVQRQVTAALGGQGVIIRHVQFPVMTPDELREVLRWEAEHHIPIPPAEAVVDFTVMPGQGDADERGNRQMRVMLVGAQKRVVEAQIQALRKAKLIPRGVDAEALACYRVVEAAGHFVADPLRYAQAVVDLGHSSTKLGIYLRGALEMSRTLGIGGRTFTSVLTERLKVPEMEAETLKRQYGVHPEGGRVLQALAPTLQDLMFEVRRSFEFFASRHFGQSVRHVYLIGGGARMPGLGGALGRYLNPSLGERIPEGAETRVEVIDPLTAVGLSPRFGRQANVIGPEFVTALGLALTEEEAPPA